MSLSLSGIAADQRSKRYATAKRWASRRTREELVHIVAVLFERQIAGIGQYGSGALARRRGQKAVHDRAVGYVLKGKMQAKRGGQQTAKKKKAEAAAEWQDACIKRARELIAQGTSPRDLVGKLLPHFDRSARQVLEVLKKAEVK